MNMIERLSRAIAAAERLDPDGAVMVGMKTVRAWESRLPHAKAVLHELKEPTEAMVEEAISDYVGNIDAELTWKAMIQAAINEGVK